MPALGAALLFAGLTSCSDDFNSSSEDNKVTALETSALDVLTDPQGVPQSVFNYTFGRRATRGSSDDYFRMPDAPTIPDGLPDYVYWDCPQVSVVRSDIESGLHNMGQTIYIAEGVKFTITGENGHGDQGAKIYVMPGATLEFSGQGFEASDGLVEIYNYGNMTFKNGENQCRLGGRMTILSKTDLKDIPVLNFACVFKTEGAIIAKKVHFNNSADTYVGCKIDAEEIIFDNESYFSVGYMKASKSILFESHPKVVLRDMAYVETPLLDIENVQSSHLFAEDGDIAYVKVGTLKLNNLSSTDLQGTMGNIYLDYKKLDGSHESTEAAFNESVRVNKSEELNIKINSDNDCAPITVLPKDETPQPSLENITTIVNGHSHPISATCIQINEAGDKAYLSWHERGAGIQGCVEALQWNANDELELKVWAQNDDADFNHIILDNYNGSERLLTVGHTNKKGAIIGQINLTGGLFTQGSVLEYTTLKGNRVPHADNPEFYGGDGNCIIRNGDYLQVASYGGLHTLNLDLSRINDGLSGAVPTTGSAKHLALANGKLLQLNLTERVKDAESSPAQMRVFDANDLTWSNPEMVASDLTIAPVDGKNTIAIDSDGAIYVCLGKNGVNKYVGNSLVKNIRLGEGENHESPANGIAIDDKYIYVASGSGVYIYAKSNLDAPVIKYHTKFRYDGTEESKGSMPSCNYVAVKGDKIYLAYGRAGVEVLRFKNR